MGWSLVIRVQAKGYYDEYPEWHAKDRPPDAVTVTLTPESPRVRMIIHPMTFRQWKQPTTEGELGAVCSGVDLDAPSGDGSKHFTDDKDAAEFWIEAVKSAEEPEGVAGERLSRKDKQLRRWRMRISGLRGWTVAPGPQETPSEEPWANRAMHIAPEQGYVDSLEYQAHEFPEGLIVRCPDGQRFGSFTAIGFGYTSIPEQVELTLGNSTALQAEAMGSRSLNPNNPPSAN